MSGMAVYENPTVPERTLSLLDTSPEPLTAADIATRISTTPPQARRALRRLEDQGAAVRQLAAGGCYAWTATRP